MFNQRAFLKQAGLGLTLTFLASTALTARMALAPAVLLSAEDDDDSREQKKKHNPIQDDPAGRLDWWRLRFGGDFTPEFMARVMREAAMQRLLYSSQFQGKDEPTRTLPEGVPIALAVAGTTWTNLGATKSNKIQNGGTLFFVNSGRLRTILPDPSDVNTLYVLTSGGGLWKTNDLLDATPTWRALSDRVGSTMGGSVAFGQPVAGAYTTLYLGTGDAFDLGVGGFMLKSTDSGSTWSAAIQLSGGGFTATRILDVKVLPGSPDIILVGTNAGLFRSTDGGTSYSLVSNATMNGKNVWSLIRTGATTWVAGVEDMTTRTGTMLRSTDGGTTWGTVTTPPPTVGRMTLANGVPGDAIAYCFAATVGDTDQKDLYKSTDGGLTWAATATNSTTNPTNTNSDQPNNDYMNGQAFYNHMVLVDPTVVSRNTVYIGGNLSSGKTTVGGSGAGAWTVKTNWLAQFGLPYAHADFHCAAFTNAGGTNRIFFGNDGGLFMSTDGGTSWDDKKNVGIVSHLPYAMASGPLNNCDANSVLMGLQDNGTHNRIGATSVFDQTIGGDGFGVGWSQATNTYSFSSYVYNAIRRCTVNPPDDIAKWANFVGGLGTTGAADNGASYYFVTPIVTAPFGADATGTVFYTYGNTGAGANSKKVFRTTSGANWASLGTLPSPGGTQVGVRAVSHGIGAHPTDPNRLAAACNGGNLAITTNAGGAWTNFALITLVPAAGPKTYTGFNASAAWVNNNVIFVCSESTTANSIHVVRTTDAGINWAARETGLPDLPVTKIVVDPGDVLGNTLYAATWLGVYRTTDQGANWSLFGSSLPQAHVTDLYIHPTSGFLRAAVWGRDIWQVGPTPLYTAPNFSSQPTGGTFTPGTPFTLSATVSNPYPTVTYQWQHNGVNQVNGGLPENISGATTASMTISTPTCALSGGVYTLVATNCAGSSTTTPATMVSSVAAPTITTQPADVAYANGANFTLSVVATGATTYQWQKPAGTNVTNVAPYTGATTANLTITGAVNGTAGTYVCLVGNGGGCTVTSNNAVVTLGGVSVPNIVSNPVDSTIIAPAADTFSVTAGGGGITPTSVTLTFQWRKNGVNLTNAAPTTWPGTVAVSNGTGTATNTLTINPTADAMNGSTYDCVVTNSAGSATSGVAKLTVTRQYTPATAVSITPSPALPVAHGTPVTFTAVGSGSVNATTLVAAPAAAYQYQFWLYIDSNLAWTMVQDYGVGSTYSLPATIQAGTYGVGVDVRTSPTVLWDVFNALNSFNLTIRVGPGDTQPSFVQKPNSTIPPFNGGASVRTRSEARSRAEGEAHPVLQ